MFGATCKAGQLVFNTFLVLLVRTHLNDDGEEKNWDRLDQFLLSFSFLDPKVQN